MLERHPAKTLHATRKLNSHHRQALTNHRRVPTLKANMNYSHSVQLTFSAVLRVSRMYI